MREMAKYLNDTGNQIRLGIGSVPGAPLTRYDSDPGQVIDGPAAYVRAFKDAGYTLVTEKVQQRLDIEADDAVREAEAKAKADAEAKAAAEREAAEAEAKAKADAEAKAAAPAETPTDKPSADLPLKGRRGSDRNAKS